MPFPVVEGVFTQGLYWELSGETLSLTERIGTRNRADSDKISIKYKFGAMVLFVGK